MIKGTNVMLKFLLGCGLALLSATSVFGMSLPETLEKTLATNPDFMVQLEQVNVQKERHNQAAAGYKPRLDLVGRAGYEHTYKEFSGSDDLEPASGSIALTQPLYRGFQTVHDLRRTAADTEAARLQLLGTAEQVALEVIQAYLQVLASEENLRVAEGNLETHKHMHSLIQDRLDAGVSDQSDTAHAEGRLALAHSNLLSAENNYMDALSDLEAVTGFSIDNFSRPADAGLPVLNSREEALKKGEENQPTYQASLSSVVAAREQYKQTRGLYLPQLDLELRASTSDQDDGEDQKEDRASAMLVMNWNLYNGGNDAAERRATLAQIAQAENNSLRVKRQVEKEIRLAWTALQFTKQQKKYMEDHVRSSEKAKELYKDQFELHRRSLLDLLDTENELFQAELAYITTDYDELAARYRLLAATGQLLGALGMNDPGGNQ